MAVSFDILEEALYTLEVIALIVFVVCCFWKKHETTLKQGVKAISCYVLSIINVFLTGLLIRRGAPIALQILTVLLVIVWLVNSFLEVYELEKRNK